MKKIILSSLILMLTVCMMGSVYGAFNCQVNMQSSKTQVSKNDEFTIHVNVSKIQSERGIISFGGILEYDKDNLTLVEMEGQNGWETPSNGTTYNASKGKIAITRSGAGKNNETIFKMTFKVKDTSKQNLMVSLKDITIADGTVPFKISNVSQNVTVTEGIQSPVVNEGTNNKKPDNSQNVNQNNTNNVNGTHVNSSSNSGSSTKTNTNKSVTTNAVKKGIDNTSVKSGSLPKAGNSGAVLMVLIGLIILVAAIFFLKIRLINQQIKE